MKKVKHFFYGTAMVTLALATTSCGKKGCIDEDAVNFDSEAKRDDGSCILEFIADDATFSNWSSWEQTAQLMGADPSLGGAHAGNDSNSVRTIYFKESQDAVNGVYPLGTVILKQSVLGDGSVEITGLVKRGNGFDASGNDWEYFMLNSDGTIAENGAMRGADLFNGMCQGCHAAASTDYVFTK
ncbi:MAG: hypothetical protein HQ500_12135 [Flavobacteriales bacterium]|nr:hypothetical protein [Flavobacteriales bacterium]